MVGVMPFYSGSSILVQLTAPFTARQDPPILHTAKGIVGGRKRR